MDPNLNHNPNTYAVYPIDRASDRRDDPAAMAAGWADPRALAIPFLRGQPLALEGRTSTSPREAGWLGAPQARALAGEDAAWVYLGQDSRGIAHFGIEFALDPTLAGPLEGLGRFEDMRALATEIAGPDAALLATAKMALEWQRSTRFCGHCGGAQEVLSAGWKRRCLSCQKEHFPRTDPVAIMLAVRGDQCLLGRQTRFPAGMWSAFAGFVEPGETFEAACVRELAEEAGVRARHVRYLFSQPWPNPHQLMIGMIATLEEGEAQADTQEIEAVRWFTREEASALINGGLATPEGRQWAPPAVAVAHWLIRRWTEEV